MRCGVSEHDVAGLRQLYSRRVRRSVNGEREITSVSTHLCATP